jgi:hypothetical protein
MERHAEVSSAALSLPRRSGSRGWRPGVQAAMSGSEDPIWPGKLAGSHRQVVDAYDVNNGSPLAFAHTFLAPNGPSGAATAVIVLRHGALPIALNNAMWERYKIGESFKIIDPETKAPAVKNPFLHPKPGVLPVDEMAIADDAAKEEVDDAALTGRLLDQVTDPIASFTADGAYDQERVYKTVAEHAPGAAVIVPPRSSAVPSGCAETAPTQRDQHILDIAKHGRMAWQKSRGYNLRANVEASIGRYKRVIGDALRSRTDETEATEVAIAAAVLNRMLGCGRPKYVRVA